ncbi:MAG: PAS domain-containing protein [Burkholderiaceae bacterium]|nr:PAS domain-containing protein [Roseateles sp.]MBV8471581.1 PAS domain-containing protein [Burkholderiaceae bacterium]
MPLPAQDLDALRELFLDPVNPVAILDAQLKVLSANAPAAARLSLHSGADLQHLQTTAGTRMLAWLKLASRAVSEGKRQPIAPALAIDREHKAQLTLYPLDAASSDGACWLLHADVRPSGTAHEGGTEAQLRQQVQQLQQERDLAYQQLDALMDTMGVGLATFQQDAGWLQPRQSKRAAGPARQGVASLQGIHRNMVETDSLPEYERLQKALKSGEKIEIRYAVRHPEWGRRWLLTRIEPGQLKSGQRTTSVITLDITVEQLAQARSEQLLRDRDLQTERERTVLDSVLVGIVTVGRHGIEWMNRSACRMFGNDLAAFSGRPISMVATPEPDHPFRQARYLDELAQGQAQTFECRVKALDGREFWVAGNAVVTDKAEHGRQLTYALLDIDRRRQAEAQTQRIQASLQRIIEVAPLAISLFDARTLHVETINQVAAALAGRTEAELLGASPEDLFGAETGPAIRMDMAAALRANSVTHREYRWHQGGQDRVWDARYLPLNPVDPAVPASEPERLLLVATDVTERRAADAARLEAVIAQRELLVREVHHRIKNNLQGVAGLMQQIAARRPEVSEVINEAIGQVQAIAQVYGLQVGSQGPMRVVNVVTAIAGSVRRMFGHPIQTSLEGRMAEQAQAWILPEAEAIPIALTLNELLTNAVKHSPKDETGGDVRCAMVCEPEHVLLRIVNQGRLPTDFQLAQVPGGVSGLGLVRALLPRRSAELQLEQHGSCVVCTLKLTPPGVSLQNAP